MSDKKVDLFDSTFIALAKIVFYSFGAIIVAIVVTPIWALVQLVGFATRPQPKPPEPMTPTKELEKRVGELTEFPGPRAFALDEIVGKIIERRDDLPHHSVFGVFANVVAHVYAENLPHPPDKPGQTPIEQARYRDDLKRFIEKTPPNVLKRYTSAFVEVLDRFTDSLPEIAKQSAEDVAELKGATMAVPLLEFLPDPATSVQAIIYPFYGDEMDGHFLPLKAAFDRNLCAIAKLPYEPASLNSPKLIFPRDHQGTPKEMVDAYLKGTPFVDVFESLIPFAIPKSAWREHAFVLGASGSGKTQLLQSLILDWLKEEDPPSLIIVDSQGDMLNKIERLALFDGALADRLIIIDPEDDEPPSLNMFDMQTPRLAGYSRNVREQVEASVIELYTYLFGALDSTLTSKQSTAFTYVARLMLSIPDATIHTFRALMEETAKGPSQFAAHIAKLDTTAREFFERQFFTKAFADTREQVARRLYDFLRVPAFDRIFSAPRNTLDMFEAMQSGKIVLVNTSKSLLKSASPLFGRYMIMQVLAAAYERVAIPESERKQAYLIVDEAHEYFDKTLEDILTQCRKYRVGLVCANQTLDQCSPDIRSTLISNTSVKLMGGLSDRDARALAPDMRTTSDFLTDTQKHDTGAAFSCFVRNTTPRAVHINIAFGALEAEPTMTNEVHRWLRAKNREAYAYRRPVVGEADVGVAVATEDNKPTAPQSPAVDPAW